MNPARLRTGEWLALVAASGFFVSLFFDWFETGTGPLTRADQPDAVFSYDPTETGWSALGIGWLVVALIPIALTAALTVTTAAPRPVAWSVYAGVFTAFTALLVTPLIALRVLVLQPGDNGVTSVEPAGYAGIGLLALVALGAWRAMGDERQGAARSAVTLPPARPVPEPLDT